MKMTETPPKDFSSTKQSAIREERENYELEKCLEM